MTEPLQDRRYNIVPSFRMQPSPGVGADPGPGIPGAGSPVVFKGENQVWFVKRQLNGTYTLYLENGGWAIPRDDEVWVNPSIGSGAEWVFEHRPGSNFYFIKLHENGLFWTLPESDDDQDKTPVVLWPGGGPFQEWFFRLVEE